MASGSGGTPAAAIHLIPVDEDWLALLDQIEQPLLVVLAGAFDDGALDLPDVFAEQAGRESWWRVRQAVRAAFDRAEQRRLLANDGALELAPLALVEIDAADLDMLVEIARECRAALAGPGSSGLSRVLAVFEREFGPPGGSSPVDALDRVVSTLTLRDDGDAELLTDAIRRGAGADVVLIGVEDEAYRRYVRRFVARMGRDGGPP